MNFCLPIESHRGRGQCFGAQNGIIHSLEDRRRVQSLSLSDDVVDRQCYWSWRDINRTRQGQYLLPLYHASNPSEAYPLNVTVDAGNVSVVRTVSVRETVIGSGTSVTMRVVKSIIVLLHESAADQHASN